mmetsp:Transcript_16675/g.15967  ORF Transcript_16675/g.15967 Transcript_16675/m.15967 type:complete len:91 (-) Transcript_16675:1855-2127(-)|eukprot:CAMPEP_0170542546 /NCGR_PEP_ID=MMETSP0211-20121228/1938_1 /TAXON_ID=311385 /ORGANISM="Pseudokeronopsis sp., Strain OXSARD2" /LENGTH=90 /DNA_ID=CAMNT_0010845643 /DNA_START=24 /DNA_END=296 /DNA_ORIENTATION=-
MGVGTAGLKTAEEDDRQVQLTDSIYRQRQYTDRKEMTRAIHNANLLKKDRVYFNPGMNDSLWNMKQKLSPKFAKYLNDSSYFKKNIRDFE